MEEYYVYVYLDPRKPGNFEYRNICFLYEPFYVGKGKGSRYKKHTEYELLDHRKKFNKIKHNIISKILNTGLTPIVDFISLNLSEKVSFELEILMIENIGRVINKSGPLSNVSIGGKGGDNYTMLSDERKRDISSKISKSLKGKYSHHGPNPIPVYQYTMNGNLIKKWDSITKVSKELKIHKYMIISCCKNINYKSAGGYLWSYKNEIMNSVKPKTKKVIQLTMDNKIVKIWDSVKMASFELGLLSSGISNCCAGRISNCGKYKWKYYDKE